MIVKCTTCDKSCSFRKEPFSPDYIALETRHTALVEAVAGMFAAQDAWARKGMASIADWSEGKALYDTARAEVDRILSEEK